ncbi:MAG: hypothetical protein J6B41_03585 [Alistipes sp.]|nr:hypothetical protein [Alistipes sp.]
MTALPQLVVTSARESRAYREPVSPITDTSLRRTRTSSGAYGVEKSVTRYIAFSFVALPRSYRHITTLSPIDAIELLRTTYPYRASIRCQ